MSEDQSNPTVSDAKSFTRNRIWRRVIVLLLVIIAGLYLLSMTASKPTNLGVNNGKLAKCPNSPNCVATSGIVESQKMPAIPFSSFEDSSAQKITAKIETTILNSFPRVKLVTKESNYLHFEFTSLIFRFVDDVEFLVNDETSQVEFRSVSRVGHSDLGANRKRMNKIIEKLK